MKKRADELIGAELDYAVAVAEGIPADVVQHLQGNRLFSYSTEWEAGGPIIRRERIALLPEDGGHWSARIIRGQYSAGPTELIAAMRAFVASRLGNEIEIPGDGNDT